MHTAEVDYGNTIIFVNSCTNSIMNNNSCVSNNTIDKIVLFHYIHRLSNKNIDTALEQCQKI